MILCGAEMARSTNSSWHRRRQWGARTWHAAAGACWCTKVTVMVMVTVRRVGLWAQPVRNAFLVALCESGRTHCVTIGRSVKLGRVYLLGQCRDDARAGVVNVVCAGSIAEKWARQHGVKAVRTWWCAKVTVMVMVTVRRVCLWAQAVLAPARRWSGEKMRATREGNTLHCW